MGGTISLITFILLRFNFIVNFLSIQVAARVHQIRSKLIEIVWGMGGTIINHWLKFIVEFLSI